MGAYSSEAALKLHDSWSSVYKAELQKCRLVRGGCEYLEQI